MLFIAVIICALVCGLYFRHFFRQLRIEQKNFEQENLEIMARRLHLAEEAGRLKVQIATLEAKNE